MPLIEIHLLEGRTAEDKKKLLASVTQAVADSIDAPLQSIRVWINELSADDYMVAGHMASDRRKPSG
ncbi:MAG TPA: 2-hydroxymuconate tautomerase [Candidatus Polarisedimenticolaceae bacterium]|nr:2-hydroxymuconate tautomerase [Candidatus Polarisedimenticolaceae bacterium]